VSDLRKHIAFLLLAIYSVILFHDIIPHHHHDKNVIFDINLSCCDHQHDKENSFEDYLTTEDNCACNFEEHPHQKSDDSHQDCKPFKVELSKLFTPIFFSFEFQQEFIEHKISFIQQFTVSDGNKFTFLSRGPPIHV